MNLKNIKLQYVIYVVGAVGVIWYFMNQPKEHPVGMGSKEAVQLVVDSLKTLDTEKYRIESVQWNEKDKLTDKLEYISVSLVDKDGERYGKDFYLNGTSYEPESKGRSTVTRLFRPIQIADFKSDDIVKQIESAVSQLPDELEFKSVAKYRISSDLYSDNIEHRFTIRVTKKGEKQTRTRRSVITNFYELEFDVQPDGTVIFKE